MARNKRFRQESGAEGLQSPDSSLQTLRLGGVLCAVAAVLLGGCEPSASPVKPVTLTGRTMGTTYTVKLARLPEGSTAEQIHAGIVKRLDAVNRKMSTWRDDSEISRFNASRSSDWFSVSDETALVVREAQRISALSGGAFDITVGPLVNLWSFGPDNRRPRIPPAEEIEAVQQRVGYDKLAVRSEPAALQKSRAELSVDLSAIAKGFGVDRISEYLDQLHVGGYLVEIGGEVRCRGKRPDGRWWRIGIQSPKKRKPVPYRAVPLKNAAMATSGGYRNYFEQQGRRYSHSIDPRTGRPVEHRLVSVSVIHESCMTADALATAIMVLGPEDGYNLAQEYEFAVFLLISTDEGLIEQATPAFQRQTGRADGQ